MSFPTQPLIRVPHICTQCLSKSKRNFSTSRRLRSKTASAPPAPPSSGFAELKHRRIVTVSGEDAPKFLQGLTTNNVNPARDDGWYTGFLNAQGRVLWDAFIYPYVAPGGSEKSYLVEVDSDGAAQLAKHFKMHKLRSKVKIQYDKDAEWRIWSIWQDNDVLNPSEPAYADSVLSQQQQIAIIDSRLPALGHRLVYPATYGTPNQVFARYESLHEAPLSAYTIRRYLHGIPEGWSEMIRETALPLESNIDYMNGIDFRKGCYIGQELTIRTQHTGVVRKRILPVQLYTESAPTSLSYNPEASVTQLEIPQGSDIKGTPQGLKRPVGKLLTSIGNIGLALCRLQNMTDMKIAEGSTHQEDVDFDIPHPSGSSVKVRAFVPQWIRRREQEKQARRESKKETTFESLEHGE